MKKLVYILFFLFLISSCASSSSTVSKNTDFRKYKYASITTPESYSGSAMFKDMSILIYEEIENLTQLTMIGDKKINTLSEEEQDKVLNISYRCSATDEYVYGVVTLTEYTTGKPIATFQSKEPNWDDDKINSYGEKCIRKCITNLKKAIISTPSS